MFQVYKYLGDKWLICRSPRATITVNKGDVAEASRQVDQQHLGDMLGALSMREPRDQRVNNWVLAAYDSDSDS